MLSPIWQTSPLLEHSERQPVEIAQSPPRSRWPALRVFAAFAGYLWGNGWRRLSGRYDPDEAAVRLRHVYESLGGLWIKIGQLLSLRTDIFSEPVCRELSRLQNKALGFPFEEVESILARELGCDPSTVFAVLDPQPLAAASVSQVHRAVLRKEGKPVVVKVLRPTASEDFLRDLAVLRQLVGLIETMGFMSHVHWGDAMWELERMVQEEIDFRHEAINTRRMRRILREHEVYVPKVFKAYCTRFVLVTEFVQGVLLSEFIEVMQRDPARLGAWCDANGVQPGRLGRRIFESTLRQFLEDNLFHADLHPGNIILLRRNRFALIDFGTVGRCDREFITNYKASLQALSARDFGAAADITMRMAIKPPEPGSLSDLREELIQSYRNWETRTELTDTGYHTRSLASAGNESGQIMYRYKVQLSWAFMRISRTWTTLDASLNYLVPEANYLKLFKRYFRRAQQRRMAPRRLVADLVSGAAAVWRGVEQYNALIAPVVRRQVILAKSVRSFSDRMGAVLVAVARGAKVLVLSALVLGGFALEDLYFPDVVKTEVVGVRSIAKSLSHLSMEQMVLGLLAFGVAWWVLRRAIRALSP